MNQYFFNFFPSRYSAPSLSSTPKFQSQKIHLLLLRAYTISPSNSSKMKKQHQRKTDKWVFEFVLLDIVEERGSSLKAFICLLGCSGERDKESQRTSEQALHPPRVCYLLTVLQEHCTHFLWSGILHWKTVLTQQNRSFSPMCS